MTSTSDSRKPVTSDRQAFDSNAFPLGPLAAPDTAAAAAATVVDPLQWFQGAARRCPAVRLDQAPGNRLGESDRGADAWHVAQITTHSASRPLAPTLMRETEAVARGLGIEPGLDLEQRLERARQLRQGVQSSMLQDVERGRETERGAILAALVELAHLAPVPVPHVETRHACMQLLDENRTTVQRDV